MSRLTIELSKLQHQKIKAMAAFQGKSMKEFVLEKIFQDEKNNDDQSWLEFEHFLERNRW